MGKKEVIVVLDPNSMEKSKLGSITCNIYLKINNEYFPENRWNDFAVVILGWWLKEVLDLLKGYASEIECLFMDGPFLFKVINNRSLYHFKAIQRGEINEMILEEEINLSEFISSLITVTKQVLSECKSKSWDTKDIHELKKNFNEFQGCHRPLDGTLTEF